MAGRRTDCPTRRRLLTKESLTSRGHLGGYISRSAASSRVRPCLPSRGHRTPDSRRPRPRVCNHTACRRACFLAKRSRAMRLRSRAARLRGMATLRHGFLASMSLRRPVGSSPVSWRPGPRALPQSAAPPAGGHQLVWRSVDRRRGGVRRGGERTILCGGAQSHGEGEHRRPDSGRSERCQKVSLAPATGCLV